jgi:ubiquitin-protein ligase
MAADAVMINFQCGGCGRSFSVPPAYAGKQATCKTCGTVVTVPAAPAPAAPLTSAPRIPMRVRRLRADAEQIAQTFNGSGPIRLKSAVGDPPATYQLEYFVRGLAPGKGSEPTFRENHLVEIQLTSDYPRLSPHCRMLTPIFHPNIDAQTICVGDHWTAGERLVDLAIRIGEMIAYQAYNIKSPLNGEAAMWADLNHDKIPTDARAMVGQPEKHPGDRRKKRH